LAIEICSHCNGAVGRGEKGRFCGQCGKELVVVEAPEEDFDPLLLIVDIQKSLRLKRNTVCMVYFRNLDRETIEDVRLKIESSVLEKSWEGRVRRVERGLSDRPAALPEVLPRYGGKTVLYFTLEFKDPRGADRVYEGSQIITIEEPEDVNQSAQVTFDLSNANFRGIGEVDFSKLIELPNVNMSPKSAPEDVCRIPIPLTLDKFSPPEEPHVDGEKAPPISEPSKTAVSQQAGETLPRGMERARLAFEGPETGRKTILLTQPTVALGVRKFTRDPRVGLTLRRLPCRSERQDPENWAKNRMISSIHASIRASADGFDLRDEGSKNGTFLLELPGEEGDAPGSVGDGATMFQTSPDFNGQAIPAMSSPGPPRGAAKPLVPAQWTRLPSRSEVLLGNRVMLLRAQTFSSSKRGLYALRLTRPENCPELEFIHVVQRAYIGSGPKCPIRIADPCFPALAAALDFLDGWFLLLAGVDDPPVTVDGMKVRSGRKHLLKRPCRIQIGDWAWRFEEAGIEDFTEIEGAP
jgi:hypothetical protein